MLSIFGVSLVLYFIKILSGSKNYCRYCSFKAKVKSVTFNYKYLRYNLSDILNKTLAQAFTLASTRRCNIDTRYKASDLRKTKGSGTIVG